MRVFKFGGASVTDAEGVKNLGEIIKNHEGNLIVVISAMGKTTNAMENLVQSYFDQNKEEVASCYQVVKQYHQQIVSELLGADSTYQNQIEVLLERLWIKLQSTPSLNFDFEYDQIVPFGELFSTTIVSAYLNASGQQNEWVDIRDVLKTDDIYRDAGVDWELTHQMMKDRFQFKKVSLYLTQGFIGSTINNLSTTLGREGSDYTGAIIAHVMDGEYLAIWKDVPGVLNADPRWYPRAKKLDELSYWEAIELTYYGAQVIHPKTLKPLQNKGIPLYVNSFINPENKGTVIRHSELKGEMDPVFILKTNQVIITVSPKDFSFIMEDNLSEIFSVFSKHRVKMNLMQVSALNFSVCVDEKRNLDEVIVELGDHFLTRYNKDVELVTVRHYTDEAVAEMIANKEVIDSQISRRTARYVVKKSDWNFN